MSSGLVRSDRPVADSPGCSIVRSITVTVDES